MLNNLENFKKILEKEKDKLSPELQTEIKNLLSEVLQRRTQLKDSFEKISYWQNITLGQAINNRNL